MNFQSKVPSKSDGPIVTLLRPSTRIAAAAAGVALAFAGSAGSAQTGAIWRPAPGTSWQWQLQGTLDTSFDVDMYNIDLFDTSVETIDALHSDGRVVICYFSAGTWEDWRPDAEDYPAEVIGGEVEGWPGERWLDIRQMDILTPIIEARLDLARSKHCDGVEPDNLDGYTQETGFPLAAGDQLAFNRWIAELAHKRLLSVGLKNDIRQVPLLVSHFDWALNEQCFEFEECTAYTAFTAAGKAVFGVEYTGDPAIFCPEANAMNFDWLKKEPDLGPERIACREAYPDPEHTPRPSSTPFQTSTPVPTSSATATGPTPTPSLTPTGPTPTSSATSTVSPGTTEPATPDPTVGTPEPTSETPGTPEPTPETPGTPDPTSETPGTPTIDPTISPTVDPSEPTPTLDPSEPTATIDPSEPTADPGLPTVTTPTALPPSPAPVPTSIHLPWASRG